jgi:hypothetical protein
LNPWRLGADFDVGDARDNERRPYNDKKLVRASLALGVDVGIADVRMRERGAEKG